MSSQVVRVGCGVLLFNDKNQFLLMIRKAAHGSGTYAFCGGWMEFGETFEQAASREVMEELGVDIKDVKVVAVSSDMFDNGEKHCVSVMMLAKIKDGEPVNMEQDKCDGFAWYDDWGNLPRPLFIEYDKHITQDVIDKYLKD